MHKPFVISAIRRLSLTPLIVSLAGLAAVACGLLFSVRYLYNAALGPFAIDREALLGLQDASRFQYFVTVDGDDHADTGFTYVSRTDSGKETTEAYYHALVLDDRLLLVRIPQADIGNTVTGALREIPSDVQAEVIADLERDVPEIEGAFLPAMLDADNFYTDGLIGLGIAGVVGLLSLFGAGLSGYRMLQPEAHPALKALARFGETQTVVAEIDQEIAAQHEQVGKLAHFTRSWLVTNSLQAARYRDIVWAYKQVTQHRTNGVPTGKTYAAHILDRHGKDVVVAGKEADVNQTLQNVTRFSPGIITGYSEELSQLWNKDRAALIAAVDQRRNAPG